MASGGGNRRRAKSVWRALRVICARRCWRGWSGWRRADGMACRLIRAVRSARFAHGSIDPAQDRTQELLSALAALPPDAPISLPAPPPGHRWTHGATSIKLDDALREATNGPWSPMSVHLSAFGRPVRIAGGADCSGAADFHPGRRYRTPRGRSEPAPRGQLLTLGRDIGRPS